MKFLLELLRSDFLEEKKKKERKKIRSMNLYPRLCSSFLRRSSNNRCSLSSDLFVNLSGRRLETICYSYRPSLPRSAHAPAGWSCFCWLNHHPGLSKRAFHLSLGTVLAPRTRFVPFERQVPLVASIFDVHPPT